MEKNKPKDLYEKTKNKMGYKGLYQLIIKRIIDIIICLVLLPFVIIILIPIAIAIKLDDNGPIFYHSNRIGVNFKEFKMLKFRSMKVDAPDIRNTDGSTFNSNSDSRVTRVGRFLRETSLDEIPQIFNIIKGDSGIIGTTKKNLDFTRVSLA